MSTPLSNIRVFIQWADQTVFAGEDVECEITFRNIASNPTPARSSLQPPPTNGFGPRSERQRKPPTGPARSDNVSGPRPAPPVGGHRTTLSLSGPVGADRSQGSGSWAAGHAKPPKTGHAHKRSVSIISIGASEGAADDFTSHGSAADGSRRMMRSHGRSASLQLIPRRHGGPTSAPLGQRFPTQPSPLIPASTSPTSVGASLPERPARRQAGTATAPNTPAFGGAPFARRSPSASFAQGFKFPADERGPDAANVEVVDLNVQSNGRSPKSRDPIPIITGQITPAAKVLSPASIAGTPRSSGEFYSLSNNSSETIASEYVPHSSGAATYANHARRPSNLASINHHRSPEVLMMGYAQIHGSFTLDGSLISQGPFEEVKRKGAVGGQGGGVIGIETKRESLLSRGFGWSNIGESIGGLLGGGELSSMKDMRGIANSRSIPLLSTPQSILFVDLRLAPGESRSYKYSFKLPRGLPPSHRGKAIKISYKLVVGTQRPGGAKEQQVKSVEVPFRILGSVNSHGELLGHDLMSPYILLRDQARVKHIKPPSSPILESPKAPRENTNPKPNASTLNDFLLYVDELLARPRQGSNRGLLSPTEASRSRRQSYIEEPSTAKEAIDMAILRSNTTSDSQQSANRFEIARSGRRVAVVMLARPAYRLGETITAAIDFTDAEIPCYAIHAALETSEKVDSSIALRSVASILRATRKAYVTHSESTLFARRVVFAPTIPASATPEFVTSGVSLDWRIRIEFVTPRLSGTEGEPRDDYKDLLEEVSRDDRGSTLAAAEVLDCESFEIAVPLTVYGALASNSERDESPPGGLAV